MPGTARRLAVEAQLTGDEVWRQRRGVALAVGAEDGQRHRQVEGGAFLAQVGGGEVDHDLGLRPFEVAVFDRAFHALLRFLQRGVGQPDHHKLGQLRPQVRLHLDGEGVQPHD